MRRIPTQLRCESNRRLARYVDVAVVHMSSANAADAPVIWQTFSRKVLFISDSLLLDSIDPRLGVRHLGTNDVAVRTQQF